MSHPAHLLSTTCLLPVIGGSLYSLLSVWTASRFFRPSKQQPESARAFTPPVTVLKPVRGLEKDLKSNLRSACTQDYPDYQVAYSVQSPEDPALPILEDIRAEFGPERVSVTVSTAQAGANGKVNNLLGALQVARHEFLVISDSDTDLRPDYLKTIVAPLADAEVGCACTPFKLTRAERWFEKLELLTINADFIPSVIFAEVTGASKACLGPSLAIRKSTLKALGGLESLADYLVEDYELGRRVWSGGRQVVLVPYTIDAVVDLKDWRHWWDHQVYWDQNTYLARPGAFVATILIRAVPFALLFALARGGDPWGLAVLAAAIAVRLLTAALTCRALGDAEGLRNLSLLPLRDAVGPIFWGLAFSQRRVVWRGVEFRLTEGGKMVPLRPETPGQSTVS